MKIKNTYDKDFTKRFMESEWFVLILLHLSHKKLLGMSRQKQDLMFINSIKKILKYLNTKQEEKLTRESYSSINYGERTTQLENKIDCPYCKHYCEKTCKQNNIELNCFESNELEKEIIKEENFEIGYIYKITNLINKKIYIGKHISTTFDPDYFGSGRNINKAIEKYGIENFKIELECWAKNNMELDNLEIKYILQYRKLLGARNCYNIADGGGDWNKYLYKNKKTI